MATRRKKASKRRATPRKAVKVVSLSTALKMVKKAKANPCGGAKANPKRHFPKLAGRGRPTKVRTFKLTTVLSNGAKGHASIRTTHDKAHAEANRILKKTFQGKKVREVILDDGR
jgi:hypothetical protein